MNKPKLLLAILAIVVTLSCASQSEHYEVVSFAKGGYYKMLYDRRQRPQTLCIGDKVHIVYNGHAIVSEEGKTRTTPSVITYDIPSREFSDPIELTTQKNDHHYAPVIFGDAKDHIHILYGCHKTPGTHLVSKRANQIGTSVEEWSVGAEISPSISYPTFYSMADGREICYHRFGGHSGEWTYSISADDGQSWTLRPEPVTNLDMIAYPEWSSYQTKLPSADGKYLYVVFMDYDDNKKNIAPRMYNPRYKKDVGNGWKYNLYLVKIDIESGEVTSFDGEVQPTPIHLDQAKAECQIWDTEWRGAGVPPDIVLDKNGNPAMLHVLSEGSTEEHFYHFVRYVDGEWRNTPITASNHQWNSCHIALDDKGIFHAYLLVGDEQYFHKTASMEDHGGGSRIEEWISSDDGQTWSMKRDLTPTDPQYEGFRYSNIQPVTTSNGKCVDDLFVFYGWKQGTINQAEAFLMNLK